MYDYKISPETKEMFNEICPKSYVRCSTEEELNFKIIRLYDLGKKITLHKHDKQYAISNYYDLLLKLNKDTNTIESISKDHKYYSVIKKGRTYDGYRSKYNEYWNTDNKLSLKLIKLNSKMSVFLEYLSIIPNFLKYLANYNKYYASFDGSYRIFEDIMGIGYEIKKGNKIIHRFSQIIDVEHFDNKNTISFKAEVESLKLLLEKIEDMKIRKINIIGDHLGLIDSVNRNTKKKLSSNLDDINRVFRNPNNKITLNWVPRSRNSSAHSLANGVM